MKRVLIILGILVACIAAYFIWLRWSPNKFIDGYYLIPSDAVMVIETEDPVGNWQEFSSSNLWQGVRRFPAFAEITKNADLMDEVIKSNQQVFALLGQKHLLISIHMTKAKDYDFVYYADMQEASKSSLIQASLTSLIKQFNFTLTVRDYHKVTINEFLDPETREVLSIAYINNYLVCSYSKQLIQNAIDASQEPTKQMGIDPRFTELNRFTAADGMCRVFINYAYFDKYLGVYMDDVEDVKQLFSSLYYTGLDCNLKDDILLADGYTLVNDSLSSYMQALSISGKSSSESPKVFSDRASFFFSMGFSDFKTFYDNLQKSLEKHSEQYIEQQTAIKKLERVLNIDVNKNIFSWMGSEVALAQYESDVLIGNKVRSIMAIKTTNVELAKENLDLIEKQIRKRTPIRFNDILYRGYEIKYIEVKGLFKSFFGTMFAKVEKPFYTILNDYVVLSDDPKTLLLTIDDFIEQKTLANKAEFRAFRDNFADKTSVLAYLSPDHHFKNFRGLLNKESWKSSLKNQAYIRCFQHVGISLSGDGDRMRTVIGASYKKWSEPVEDTSTISEESDTLSSLDQFLIKNFQGNLNTKYYPNGNPKASIEMDGKVRDGVYIEFYENGTASVRASTRMD
ncbi:MAG: DUF3352 domain-containing protein [Bacteroidia bacterium]